LKKGGWEGFILKNPPQSPFFKGGEKLKITHPATSKSFIIYRYPKKTGTSE
jgi:hypothetical protein